MNDGDMRFEKMSEEVDLKPVEACSSYEVQKINLDQDSKDFVIHEVFHSAIPLQLPNKSLDPDNWQEPSSFAIQPRSERKTLVKSEMAWIKEESSSIEMDFDEEEVKFKPLISLIAPITTSSVTGKQVVMPLVKQETEDVFLESPSEEKTSCGPLVNFVKEEPHFSLEDHTSSVPLDFHVKKDCDICNEDIIDSDMKKIKTEPCKEETLSGKICKEFYRGICKEEDSSGNVQAILNNNSPGYEDHDKNDYESFDKLLLAEEKIDKEEPSFIACCEDSDSLSFSATGAENKCKEDKIKYWSCTLQKQDVFPHDGLNTLNDQIKSEKISDVIAIEKTSGVMAIDDSEESDVKMIENKTTCDVVVLSSDDENTEEFVCGLCNVKKTNSHDLTIHIDTVHKGIPNTCSCIHCRPSTFDNINSFCQVVYQPFKCRFCAERFIRLSDLKRHTRKTHFEEDSFALKCEYCSFISYTNYEMKDHCGQIHDKFKGFYCVYCEKMVKGNGEAMRRHIFKHHTDLFPYKCSSCEYKSLNCPSIIKHARREHLESVKNYCSVCNFHASSKQELADHLNKNHLECLNTEHICKICKKQFSSKKKLLLHDQHSCGKTINKIRCRLCRWPVASLEELRNHMKRKHRPDVYACTQCNFKTISISYLETHMISIHNDLCTTFPSSTVNTDDSIVCEFCTSRFQTAYELQLHKNTDHKDKLNYSCKSCKFTAFSKVELQNHYFENHSGLLKCSLCNSRFYQKAALQNHIKRQHNDQTKYFCKVCKKYMKSMLALQKHFSSVHYNGLPYNCSSCPYKCLTKKEITLHINSKHSEVDFVDVVH